MPTIDNVNHRLIDELKQHVKKKSKIAIAASSFSIYAYEALRKELESIEELRFIFTSPSFLQENFKKEVPKFFIPHLFKEADLCGGEFELRLKNRLNQRAIARECSKWVKEKVTFKANKQISATVNGMMGIENNDVYVNAYAPVTGFTTTELGITPNNGFPTFIQKTEYPDSKDLLKWFNSIWDNEDFLEDVTQKVQAYFTDAFKENSPEFIYFITLYNIFNDFLDDISLD